jgi:hypothetical protein
VGVLIGEDESEVAFSLELDVILVVLNKISKIGVDRKLKLKGVSKLILTQQVKQTTNQEFRTMDRYLKIIITINISIDDIHTKGIGVIELVVFFIEDNVGVLFVFRDGNKVGEDIVFVRSVRAHLDSHVLVVAGF